MTSEALIESLSDDLKPVCRHAVERTLALGLIAGAAVTMILVSLLFGIRSDLDLASGSAMFWIRCAYTVALGLCALLLVAKLSRPDAGDLHWRWLFLIPFGCFATFAIWELASTPPEEWRQMWLGRSWHYCSAFVLVLSLPIFAGLVWSLRRLAPTHLRAAGAAAGFCAGAVAASLYGLHCSEPSAVFVMTWYNGGVALAAGIGAALGPYTLRW